MLDCWLEEGCSIVCYADNTLVLATAGDATTAATRVNVQTFSVTHRIRRLGLKISTAKTQAIVFHGRRRLTVDPLIMVERDIVPVSRAIKYLGVILDGRLTFNDHFVHVEAKACKMARALSRLMPNFRGPQEAKRRLYARTMEYVILYGAPVWSGELSASKTGQMILRRVHRTIAIRVVSAYRTASSDAVLLLARMSPLQLMASTQKRILDRLRDLRRLGQWSKEREEDIKRGETYLLRQQWRLFLQRPNAAGALTRRASSSASFRCVARQNPWQHDVQVDTAHDRARVL